MRMNVPPGKSPVVGLYLRFSRGTANDRTRILEIERVVCAPLCVRRNGGDGRATSPSTASTLLIVFALGWYRAKSHSRERADVNTDLHGRRTTEYVNGRLILSHRHVLKPK